MKRIGDWQGQPVGCFFVLRNDTVPPVPVLTLHRITREQAYVMVRSILQAGMVNGYSVAGLNSECDCQGRAQMEAPALVRPR